MTNDFKKEKKEDYFVNLKAISTEVLQEKVQDNAWVIVDTRLNDAYNGWKLDGVKRGGHIKGAVDFSANWLSVYLDRKDEVLEQALKTKRIDLDKNIVLYDANGKDALVVADYLSKKGYKYLYKYFTLSVKPTLYPKTHFLLLLGIKYESNNNGYPRNKEIKRYIISV